MRHALLTLNRSKNFPQRREQRFHLGAGANRNAQRARHQRMHRGKVSHKNAARFERLKHRRRVCKPREYEVRSRRKRRHARQRRERRKQALALSDHELCVALQFFVMLSLIHI